MVSYLVLSLVIGRLWMGLNPYCSGRWSRTLSYAELLAGVLQVLILIVVEDGLVLDLIRHY